MAALPLPKALRAPGEQATPGATSCWPPVTPGQPWGFHAESLVGSVSTHAHPYRASACPEVQGPLWGFSVSRGTGPPTGLQHIQGYRAPYGASARPGVQGPLRGFSASRGTGPPTGLQCVQGYRAPYGASAYPGVQGPLRGFSASRGTGPPMGLQHIQGYRAPYGPSAHPEIQGTHGPPEPVHLGPHRPRSA